ncbi:phage tail tube protein [Pararoseomonas indoligenes]|uniref:Phage tail tube protein n=1 Tax=Roseomonas indoligenes TaxID=2820811 RepID=A0A940MQJ0_9PROT|nr:phage tail tube protein [Pararoseomonas indoligenes]MBP0492168.1 phage tail tube protein [Pararoseomonas indoligenes]
MSESNRRIGGIGAAFVDGLAFDLRADPMWKVSTRTRTTVAGMDRIHGYSETISPGFISFTLSDRDNITVGDFENMTNSSVSLELASGKRVSGTGMWTVESQEVNATEGTFSVRFEGEDVRET